MSEPVNDEILKIIDTERSRYKVAVAISNYISEEIKAVIGTEPREDFVGKNGIAFTPEQFAKLQLYRSQLATARNRGHNV